MAKAFISGVVVNISGGAESPDEPVTPEYSEGLDYYYDEWQEGYIALGYGTWDGEHLVIPSTHDDGEHGELPVTELGYDTFGNHSKVKSVTLPDSIDWISGDVFNNCPNLTHLYMPYITSIASITMMGSSFEYVQLRDIVVIGGYAFHYCQYCVFDFTDCATIPALDSYGAGEEFGINPIIRVPASLLDEWKNATNWTLYADYIVAGA